MTGRHSRLRAAFQASFMTIWPRADFPTLRPTFVTSSLGPVSLEVSYLRELRPLSHLSHQGSKWEAAYLANFPKAVYLWSGMQGGHKADPAQPFNAGFLAAEHRPPLHVAHRH